MTVSDTACVSLKPPFPYLQSGAVNSARLPLGNSERVVAAYLSPPAVGTRFPEGPFAAPFSGVYPTAWTRVGPGEASLGWHVMGSKKPRAQIIF